MRETIQPNDIHDYYDNAFGAPESIFRVVDTRRHMPAALEAQLESPITPEENFGEAETEAPNVVVDISDMIDDKVVNAIDVRVPANVEEALAVVEDLTQLAAHVNQEAENGFPGVVISDGARESVNLAAETGLGNWKLDRNERKAWASVRGAQKIEGVQGPLRRFLDSLPVVDPAETDEAKLMRFRRHADERITLNKKISRYEEALEAETAASETNREGTDVTPEAIVAAEVAKPTGRHSAAEFDDTEKAYVGRRIKKAERPEKAQLIQETVAPTVEEPVAPVVSVASAVIDTSKRTAKMEPESRNTYFQNLAAATELQQEEPVRSLTVRALASRVKRLFERGSKKLAEIYTTVGNKMINPVDEKFNQDQRRRTILLAAGVGAVALAKGYMIVNGMHHGGSSPAFASEALSRGGGTHPTATHDMMTVAHSGTGKHTSTEQLIVDEITGNKTHAAGQHGNGHHSAMDRITDEITKHAAGHKSGAGSHVAETSPLGTIVQEITKAHEQNTHQITLHHGDTIFDRGTDLLHERGNAHPSMQERVDEMHRIMMLNDRSENQAEHLVSGTKLKV